MISDVDNSLALRYNVETVTVFALRYDLVLRHVNLRLQLFRQKLDKRLVKVEDRVASQRLCENVLNDFFPQRRRYHVEKRLQFVLRVEQTLRVRQVAGHFGLQFLGQVEVLHCRRCAVEFFLKIRRFSIQRRKYDSELAEQVRVDDCAYHDEERTICKLQCCQRANITASKDLH